MLNCCWNICATTVTECWCTVSVAGTERRCSFHYCEFDDIDLSTRGECKISFFFLHRRILLWADGAIHQSLNAIQMLYFTLAYDWYLFGHNLPGNVPRPFWLKVNAIFIFFNLTDRLSKGEEILFFCFYVLKYFHSDEFCTTYTRRATKNSVSSSSSSSVCVLRTDSGGDIENMFSEMESTGSNLSLNSMESGRSHNDAISHSDVFIECSNG